MRFPVAASTRRTCSLTHCFPIVFLLTSSGTATAEIWCDAAKGAGAILSVEYHAARSSGQEPHIRTDDPALAQMLVWGEQYSARLRELIREIDRSDVVAYVELDSSLQRNLGGQMVFVSAAGGRRYVFVTLMTNRDALSTLVSLAHELAHVAEVARDLSIVDGETMLQA